MMKTGAGGLALVKSFEALRLRAYRDPVGVLTIGWGHTSAAGPPPVEEGDVVIEAEAERILEADLARFEDAVNGLTTREPNQNQFDAMVSLCMNIGAGNFAKSSVLRLFNAGDDEAAADAFAMWTKAGGKVLEGLKRRRKAEAALFRREAPIIPGPPKQETRPMKFLNLNAVQTYVSAALYAIPAVFLSLGCTQLVTGALDCSAAMLPILTPKVTLWTTSLLAVLKFAVLPALQPGGWFRNLFEPKVPVTPTPAPGTVSPAAVRPPTTERTDA